MAVTSAGSFAQNLANAGSGSPIDPGTENALVGGTTGLTPGAVNAVLGFSGDIQNATSDTTIANSHAAQDLLSQNEARAQGDQYGLQAQDFQLQGEQYGLQGDAYGVEAQGYDATIEGYGQQEKGYQQEADAYTTAAGISHQNAILATASGNLQAAQERRQISQTLGQQHSQVSSAGFKNAGSALSLYADSMRQGNLSLAQTDTQAMLRAAGYSEEEAASTAQANAALVPMAAARTAADNARTAQQSTRLAQQGAYVARDRTGLAVQGAQSAQNAAYGAAGTAGAAYTTDLATATSSAAAGVAAQTNLQNLISSINATGAGTEAGASSTAPPSNPKAYYAEQMRNMNKQLGRPTFTI